MSDAFDRLQRRLGAALSVNRAGSTVDHVLLALPSYSVSESILSHYGDRIPSLEHRYLPAILVAGRIPACEVVYVSTRRPDPTVIDYYTSLLPDDTRSAARFHVLDIDDGSTRSVAGKIAADPAMQARVREIIGGRPAFIEPWNVTETEEAMALALDVPINGTSPELRHLGFKSAGRRLFREAGVPVPYGCEGVHTLGDVVAAVADIRAARPAARGVVVKHDDSGAGDGNVVLDLPAAGSDWRPAVETQLRRLASWYVADLEAQGGIVEERVAGVRFSSPSAQADIRPDGSVQVLATHEQVLGGPTGQVYMGCRFPADPAYAPVLAEYARAIGERLARHGALGRVAVDFVAASDADGRWDVHAIEVNLRKGGTTHPYAALRNLVPGRYDVTRGAWVTAADGSARAYSATDNLVDPAWVDLEPAAVIDAVRSAGLEFTRMTGTGAVLFMLSALAIDGRLGVVAIGRTPDEAAAIESGVRDAVDELAAARNAAQATM